VSGKLKIKPEDYLVLKAAVEKVAEENPGMHREYRENGLSEMRYRWDLLWKAGLKIGDGRGIEPIRLYERRAYRLGAASYRRKGGTMEILKELVGGMALLILLVAGMFLAMLVG